MKIEIINSNNIITLSSPGKTPIKSSQGLYWYNPNELLCASVGACVGKHIVRYAAENKIDLKTFESFDVNMINETIIIDIIHPKKFNCEELTYIIHNCEVAKKLKNEIIVNAIETDKSSEDNIEYNTTKPCCCG